MTTQVNVHDAKTHFSRLLQRVMTGEEIIIARSGKPVARLLPFAPEPSQRTPGSGRGEIWVASDFDGPLSEDILAEFEGS